MDVWRDKLLERWDVFQERWATWDAGPLLTVAVFLLVLVLAGLGWFWSREPVVLVLSPESSAKRGVVLSRALADVSAVLVDKPGGYLRNDLLPPGLLLDNMPAWELGVLRQVRDLSRSLHRDMGLSHAAFVEDSDLAAAEEAFSTPPDGWMFPAAESGIGKGGEAVGRYVARLQRGEAVFQAREAYLLRWLAGVDASLGMLSTRLNAALPDPAVVSPVQGTPAELAETSWWRIDDVFYEARGSAWALLYLLKAVEVEFGPELTQRQALLSLRAAIHELEATQQTLWSPLVLNGSGFGLFANHSLVMANYLNRAQTDLSDVRALLTATP